MPKKKWQSAEGVGIYFPVSDESALVYNPLSGETHQLNQLAFDVLQVLKTPLSIESLSLQITSLYGFRDNPEINNQLNALILQLDDLGLILQSD